MRQSPPDEIERGLFGLPVLAVEVVLPAPDDAQEQLGRAGCLQVMGNAVGQLLETAELAQLLQHRAQEQRVSGAGRRDQLTAQHGLERPRVDAQIGAGHRVHLFFAGKRQFVFRPATLPQGIQRRAGQRRGDNRDVRRELPRQEAQGAVGLVALHLVQAVQHQHNAAPARSLCQPDGQRVPQFLRVSRNVFGDAETALQLAHQAVQEACG